METLVFETAPALGAYGARIAAETIQAAIRRTGRANIILATGASQFEVLAALVAVAQPRLLGAVHRRPPEGGWATVDWSKVVMFHLDEYVGLPDTHPASFRRYLRERFVEKVGRLGAVHFIGGDRPDPSAECSRVGDILSANPIDVALVGIGENGHLAFNDPPADFDAEEPYLVVDLDEACRRQQLGEGWFATLDDVPRRAISMSIRQILKSRRIVCSVPDRRKAEAVLAAVEGPITNLCPASVLRRHPDCVLLLEPESASLLSKKPLVRS